MAPGPGKVEPLDYMGLNMALDGLRHGRKRSYGASLIYVGFKDQISRRDLNEIIKAERMDINRQRDAQWVRTRWNAPGLVWAMDDSEYKMYKSREKVYLHNVQDISSLYKFGPLVTERLADGYQVAENLDELFRKHGAPLFMKRDNGSNLNHHAVDEVLAEHMVLPLNSPAYYPQYNGSIERSQRELKAWISEREPHDLREAQLDAPIAAHELNHIRRGSLSRKTSCGVFYGDNSTKRQYNRRKRREVYDWITEMTFGIMTNGDDRIKPDQAWRIAVETWLLKNDMITVTNNESVTHFFEKNYS